MIRDQVKISVRLGGVMKETMGIYNSEVVTYKASIRDRPSGDSGCFEKGDFKARMAWILVEVNSEDYIRMRSPRKQVENLDIMLWLIPL